jgi:formylglycine-generating enzyme required for sulfatase activity
MRLHTIVSIWILATLAVLCGALPAYAQKALTPNDGRELVAVLELDGINATKSQLAALSEELRTQLLKSGKFRVVDRQQIDTILKEQALQQTGCTSQDCAVQVGKILGVRKMVVGRVTKIEDALWQVSAQMVDAETGETLRAETINHEGTFGSLLTQGVAILAGKLTGGSVAPAAQSAPAVAQSAAPPAKPIVALPVRIEPVTGMEFLAIPSGEFDMGCGTSAGGACYEDERPAHRVRVGAFWLGKTEVTQAQWTQVMGANPSNNKKGATYPVEQVSWKDVQDFIARLNAKSSGGQFRLPAEAEWEYACRAGGAEIVYGTQSGEMSAALANTKSNADAGTTPAGKFGANAFGLFDLSGNVSEWVQDAYARYPDEDSHDLRPSLSGLSGLLGMSQKPGATERVVRGGSWSAGARMARCTARQGESPDSRSNYVGFRLARDS